MSLVVNPLALGNAISTATGFIATHEGVPYLVTNWHVVTGRSPETNKPLLRSAAVPDALAVLHLVPGEDLSWEWKIESLYDDHATPLWLEHPHHGQGVDVVALRLTETADVELYPYDLANPGPNIVYGPSDLASIIGFPFGMTGGGALGIWVQGTIATEPEIDYDDLPQLLIDSRTRPGQSGSPVILHRTNGYFTEDGSMINDGVPGTRFLGIYSGRMNKESDLGRVWKALALTEILYAQERGSRPRAIRS
jgi:hypothetical protein